MLLSRCLIYYHHNRLGEPDTINRNHSQISKELQACTTGILSSNLVSKGRKRAYDHDGLPGCPELRDQDHDRRIS